MNIAFVVPFQTAMMCNYADLDDNQHLSHPVVIVNHSIVTESFPNNNITYWVIIVSSFLYKPTIFMSCDVVVFYKNSAKIGHLLFDIRHRCHQLLHKILIHNQLLHNIDHSEWSGGVHKYDMAFANTISVATSAEG